MWPGTGRGEQRPLPAPGVAPPCWSPQHHQDSAQPSEVTDRRPRTPYVLCARPSAARAPSLWAHQPGTEQTLRKGQRRECSGVQAEAWKVGRMVGTSLGDDRQDPGTQGLREQRVPEG